jgi:hypothetical protein
MPSFLNRLTYVAVIAMATGTITAATILLGLDSGVADSSVSAAAADRPLKSVAEFQSIADAGARSQALFTEAAKVITDPRCMNCHPANRQPTQGDDMHPHVPFMDAGESGIGERGIVCTSCHRGENTALPGSRLRSVPGAEPWLLAPASMGWQGLTLGGICQQLKDPVRNGGRSLAQIHQHMSTDHLVGWAWHPGEGRRPAPGTQRAFGELIAAWIETGADCPTP